MSSRGPFAGVREGGRQVVLRLGLDEPDGPDELRRRVARQLGRDPSDLPVVLLRRRSLDARGGRVRVQLTLEICEQPPPAHPLPQAVSDPESVLIVGDGPAGLFCAYQLALAGIGATVVDRGKQVQPRRHDLKSIHQRGQVDPDSNYCFGEGGAGTYSDGKLYTRAHKRGPVADVLAILAQHGAPEAILSDSRPHIGSNRLPKVVSALRDRLEKAGDRFVFEARVIEILTAGEGAARRVCGVRLADGRELLGRRVVLATGHSARDVFELLLKLGVELEAKPFAVGVRIEHPQALINRIQYGRSAGHPRLPSAAYRLTTRVGERGVFSFCMCPGGFIVPAATEHDGLVVNGMSLAKRASSYANSGLVVSVGAAELAGFSEHGPLAGVELQRRLERAAFVAGGGEQRAPASRLVDFLARRGSSSLPRSSYVPGLTSTELDEVLATAGFELAEPLREGLTRFGRTLRGFETSEAVVVGVESRTSSPVRVLRHPETLQARGITGLYPCGEGAGHAGGIMSAALDGMAVAHRIAAESG